MRLHTASEIISFAKRLENESAKFYEDLCQRYTKDEDVFLSFAKENGKNVVQIERAYYGVITDAIESCFSFKINPDEYTFKTELVEKASYSDALNKAVEMADIPRAFALILKKRNNRGPKLRSLLQEGS